MKTLIAALALCITGFTAHAGFPNLPIAAPEFYTGKNLDVAMESVLLRTEKNPTDQKREMSAVFLRESMEQIEGFARAVLSASSEGDALRMNLTVLKRFTKHDPVNAVTLRRSIAARLIQAEKYIV